MKQQVEAAETEENSIPWRRFGLKLSITLMAFLLMTLLLESYAKDKVADFSKRLMDSIGPAASIKHDRI